MICARPKPVKPAAESFGAEVYAAAGGGRGPCLTPGRAIPIEDPDDPRVAPYLAIRERDLVGRGRRFIAEGEVVLRVLAGQSRHAIESLFLLENRLERLAALVAGLPESVPVYVANRPVMDRVAGFSIHRGVLAIGRRSAEPAPQELVSRIHGPALVLGLAGIANHDNVGGLFRNAAAFRADAVLIDAATCDPLYRKAIRVSVGGSLVVPFARLDAAQDMIDVLARAAFDIVALAPSGRETLDEIRWGARTALLVGAEGAGLPPGILARARTVRIPMAAGFDSLNVATAAGIALHAVRRAARWAEAPSAGGPGGGT